MSYNGTVTCSHCFQTGHNKRKCPVLTEQIKSDYERQIKWAQHYRDATDEELAKRGEDREWNTRYHDNKAEENRLKYLKRTKIDLATGEKVTNKVAKAERMKKVTCGYCNKRGHTRRVCQNVKNDYAIYVERTRQVRQEWYDRLKLMGVGIGSMIVQRNRRGYLPDGSYGLSDVTGLITKIDWDQIDAHQEGRPVVIKTNAQLRGDSGYYTPSIPDMQLGELAKAETALSPNLSVIPSGHVPPMPKGWLNDVKPIKEVFSTKDTRPWAYEYEDSDEWRGQIRADLGLPRCAYAEQRTS